MPESAEDLYARIVAQVGVDGHLPTPPVTEWDTFPWEGDLRSRVVLPPQPESPRAGEGDSPCPSCAAEPAGVIWRNERWRVSAPSEPSGLPVVVWLITHEHLDFQDMDDDLAAEYGVISNRLHRIIHNLPNIGRVHIGKWGDGSAHLHVWFMGRTADLPQTKGSFAAEWDDILPPAPLDVWRADLAEIARQLANHDGVALV